MGLTSPLVGWTIDRRGGQTVMVVGSLLLSAASASRSALT